MTEDELDRIKKSFVRSSDECPMEVACLLTVMKYYGGQQDARTLAEWCKVDGKYTLMGMKQAAIRAGMEAEICLQNMEQLSTRKFPAILWGTCKNLCFCLLFFAIKFLCSTFVLQSYSNVRESISKAIKLHTPFGVQRIF